jgi:hypothetical protein
MVLRQMTDHPFTSPLPATQIPTYNMYSKLWKQLVNGYENSELLGFWTFSIIWYSNEHNVLETGSVSILR